MDCEACTDLWVELLYEELPDEDAARARAHIDTCDDCGAAFARLQAGQRWGAMLELSDPPVSVLDSVMAAARERAAQRAPTELAEEPMETPSTARPDDAAGDGAWSNFLEWVGGFAMRPQLAMAMSLFLMVGLGMWYLPTLRQSDPADQHSIVDPAPGDEVGPSASLEPAVPLDLEANPRTGRIHARDDGQPPPRPVRVRPALPPPLEEVAVEGDGEGDGAGRTDPAQADPSEDDDRQRDIRGRLAERQQGSATSRRPSEDADAPETPAALDSRIVAAQRTIAPRREAQSASRPPSPAPVAPGSFAAAQPASEDADDSIRSVEGAGTGSSPSAAAAADQRYQRGLQRYRAHDYRGAAEDFESVIDRPGRDTRRLIPSALHHLARSQRSDGNCRAAARTYERLLRQHATYSARPDAMMEVASCYQRLGRLSDARRWLEHARTQPGVAARARQALIMLEHRERAVDAVPSQTAPPPPRATSVAE